MNADARCGNSCLRAIFYKRYEERSFSREILVVGEGQFGELKGRKSKN